jgi:hypothetical protein
MSEVPGYWQLVHRLHPQTGFMIFAPGAILLALFIAVLFSHGQAKWSVLAGIAAVFEIGVLAISFGLWSDHGHLVAWDEDAVYVRPLGGGEFFFRHHSFAAIPIQTFAESSSFRRRAACHPNTRCWRSTHDHIKAVRPSSSI